MLKRFVDAQEHSYAAALREIRAGRKESHWMWYIFPQLKGLGRSPTAEYYGITDLQEAKGYFDHPILGPRLTEISEALLSLDCNNASQIFGWPDDMKLRSCMTLFAVAAPDEPIFQAVLDKFFGGEKDPRTLALLNL